jgi:hypothetical protein
MAELMRFRQMRSPQRRIPPPESLLDLSQTNDPPIEKVNRLRSLAFPTPERPEGAPAEPASPDPLAPVELPLQLGSLTALSSYLLSNSAAADGLMSLDRWLAGFDEARQASQEPDVGALRTEVGSLLGGHLPPDGTEDWAALRTLLADLLYQALVLNAQGAPVVIVDVQSALVRLLLVTGLVDLLLADPSSVSSSVDVWNALRWRTVTLPDSVIAILLELRTKRGAVLARKPAFADLYITREEWDHYEASEIASIENILGGESKRHVHLLVNETQTTTTTDTSKTTTQSQDVTTTDQSQLQQQSSADVSLAVHVDGSVNTSASYGPVSVQAHVGGSLDYSSKTANAKATTQSHESVARAVNSVVQSTRSIRTTSTLSRDVNKEVHAFDNSGSTDPVVGVYRWVDQIQNVELDRYPHRFLMEFEIPSRVPGRAGCTRTTPAGG